MQRRVNSTRTNICVDKNRWCPFPNFHAFVKWRFGFLRSYSDNWHVYIVYIYSWIIYSSHVSLPVLCVISLCCELMMYSVPTTSRKLPLPVKEVWLVCIGSAHMWLVDLCVWPTFMTSSIAIHGQSAQY